MYTTRGLAEIVRNPSPITIKYLNTWFTGNGAFGAGLSKLGWPITKSSLPLLVLDQDKGLKMDLKVEHLVMYSKTILHYIKKDQDYTLAINPKKLLSPIHLLGTIQALWSQSKLLISPQNTYNLAKSFVESIPTKVPTKKSEIEMGLSTIVWPNIVAVDYIGEFLFAALTSGYTNEQKIVLLQKSQLKNKSKDWYTRSMLAWGKYIDKTITGEELSEEFGYAAGDAYELTKPRYYEITKSRKPIIDDLPIEDQKIDDLESLVIAVQYLRSEAKRRSLIWIDALRENVMQKDHKKSA